MLKITYIPLCQQKIFRIIENHIQIILKTKHISSNEFSSLNFSRVYIRQWEKIQNWFIHKYYVPLLIMIQLEFPIVCNSKHDALNSTEFNFHYSHTASSNCYFHYFVIQQIYFGIKIKWDMIGISIAFIFIYIYLHYINYKVFVDSMFDKFSCFTKIFNCTHTCIMHPVLYICVIICFLYEQKKIEIFFVLN